MSKCVKCLDMYHPDWIVYEEIRGEMVKVCAFCKLDRKELTVEDENGKVKEVVSKKQASINYKRWLDELIKKPEIAKLVNEENQEK